ncbi:MAG: YncE family protein [Chloroflexi bacterium]|nr:YncE family protein [Chloroflexota bacterium]
MQYKIAFISLAVPFSMVLAACETADTYPAEEIDRVVASRPTASPASAESATSISVEPTVDHIRASSSSPPRAMVPVTATRVPGTQTPILPPQPFSLPTATDAERKANTGTWLYLTGFNAYTVSVVDPVSGHSLHEITVKAQNPGVAVSPDGGRLYVLDMWWDRGEPAGKGELTTYDTVTWAVIHQEPVDNPAFLLGGNPISLSGDGRWLTMAHHPEPGGGTRPASVFDTQAMAFLPDAPLQELPDCTRPWLTPRLAGQPGHPRVYALCNDAVVALNARTLSKLWEADAPSATSPGLALSPDGTYLYGLHPQVDIRCCRGTSVYVEETDLLLSVWETESGIPVRVARLSEMVDVPDASIGRGDGAYLALSPDGQRLFVLWEDRLWDIETSAFLGSGPEKAGIVEALLPAPADAMAISSDGRELYIFPATGGNLPQRGKGMWTVDTERFEVVRNTSGWLDLPPMAQLHAAPAPKFGR